MECGIFSVVRVARIFEIQTLPPPNTVFVSFTV